jgi:hypothetical protein
MKPAKRTPNPFYAVPRLRRQSETEITEAQAEGMMDSVLDAEPEAAPSKKKK